MTVPVSAPPERERGYAMVAAVASIGVFAALSLSLLSASKLAVVDVAAEQGAMQAGAAANAGLAMALSGLLSDDVADRWSIDGRDRALRYHDARLTIRIEDERGKVPLNLLDETLATRLLEVAGLSGDRLEIARDSLLDWIDDDEEARPFGAEEAYYVPRGYYPPNGPLQSLAELGAVRGFDPALIARIAPMATVNFGFASFDPRYAHPRAIDVMSGSGTDGPASIARERELAGQRPAIELADAAEMIARPITIVSLAVLPGGARAERRMVVELTGSKERPYAVRAYE